MTNDSKYTLAIAELGKYAQEAGMYITAQPYQAGVLLSSSNASTWTSHQEMDLKFKLLGAQFTRTEADIELKREITLTDITDFKVLGNVERPGHADAAFVLVDEAGNEYTAPEGSLVTLSSKKTGTYKLLARMRGTETLAPILYENLQLLLGEIQEEGTYITRAIEAAPQAQKITVIMEVKHPGDSKCEVEYNTNTNPVYQAIPFKSGTKVDSVKDEMTYLIDGLTGGTYHIRLKLVGNAANRPEISNLRVILT